MIPLAYVGWQNLPLHLFMQDMLKLPSASSLYYINFGCVFGMKVT